MLPYWFFQDKHRLERAFMVGWHSLCCKMCLSRIYLKLVFLHVNMIFLVQQVNMIFFKEKLNMLLLLLKQLKPHSMLDLFSVLEMPHDNFLQKHIVILWFWALKYCWDFQTMFSFIKLLSSNVLWFSSKVVVHKKS